MFASFGVPNFRTFVSGQAVSLIGSWTETVAQALLVLQLTHSGLVLGLATAARYLPVLLLTPYAGLIVDRRNKRRVLLATQSSLALLSVVTGTLVITGTISIAAVFVIALCFGTITALDNPARQAFIPELVEPGLIRNAVTLNSTFVNVGRAVGPIVAAVLVASVGIGWCFYINAASFGAVLIALLTLRVSALLPAKLVVHAKGQLREGLRYARSNPQLIGPIAMMAIIGTFTYEFEVSLPLLAEGAFRDASTYSWLIGAFGTGSVIGGLLGLRFPARSRSRLIWAAVVYAVAMAATAIAPAVWIAALLLLVVGLASITFLTTGNSTIQIVAAPEYRGRVTALWSTAFLGTTPIGAAIIGAIGAVDSRWAIGVGALACAGAVFVGWWVIIHGRNRTVQGAESPHVQPARPENPVS